ncbi:2-amino-4-hydroxy-6-hydroxymethyldihydropteridine diphosphokinase [Andreprevotia chitinilytica]|uniref:2-amino-4-hydroxy-6- hydroxymethyldihydropteridine diphosphokinase n=1 Tax=Andreprevotia chitinilytica TaxID=396808 RepID=UPI00055491AF|nr:2-amino-4-hydroxy-6-hydroxymethyldihydropteridine diphosphokinase [Andreprevotia chitinilytica]
MTQVFIALGANLGRPAQQLRRACELLAWLPFTKLIRVSSFYRSPAMGYADQPDFINAVVMLETGLAANELLESMFAIEGINGRTRSFRNAPRTLDLDLLLFGDETIHHDGLTVPHPRLQERAFVLRPLLEIAPDIVIPGLGPAKDYLPGITGQAIDFYED